MDNWQNLATAAKKTEQILVIDYRKLQSKIYFIHLLVKKILLLNWPYSWQFSHNFNHFRLSWWDGIEIALIEPYGKFQLLLTKWQLSIYSPVQNYWLIMWVVNCLFSQKHFQMYARILVNPIYLKVATCMASCFGHTSPMGYRSARNSSLLC